MDLSDFVDFLPLCADLVFVQEHLHMPLFKGGEFQGMLDTRRTKVVCQVYLNTVCCVALCLEQFSTELS